MTISPSRQIVAKANGITVFSFDMPEEIFTALTNNTDTSNVAITLGTFGSETS